VPPPQILRLLLALTPLLGACGSSRPEREPTPLMSQTMEQRLATTRKRMTDPNDRSRFDPGIQSTLARQRGNGKAMTGKQYKSSAFNGGKSYAGTPSYRTETWSEAERGSGLSDQTYVRSDAVAAGSDSTFRSGESRLGNQTARAGSEVFDDASASFRTHANREGLRSQQKNERPQFIQLEEQRRNPAYSEEQVRRLLGRN
jgi:hypothetical protein